MKILRSALLRAVCSIIVGVLLIQYPDNTVTWLTVAIGALFLLSGVISCLTWLNAARNASRYTITDARGRVVAGGRPPLPVVGIGSVVFGALLAARPTMFVAGLMYVLGAVLILGAVSQFLALVAARRLGRFTPLYWVCPSIVLLVGLYVMFKPMESASLPLVILGWCSLLYGVTEIINSVKIYSWKKQVEKMSGGTPSAPDLTADGEPRP